MRRRLQGDDVEAPVQQLRARGYGELVEAVDGARLERGRHRRLFRVEGPLDLGRQCRGSPVVGVPHEDRPDVRGVALHLEPAGAGEFLLVVRVVVPFRDDDHVVVVVGHRVGPGRVRVHEVEGDGGVVNLHHAGRVECAAEDRQGVGRALRVGLGLEAVDDVVHGHGRTVVELHALADLEGPHRGVGVGAPACRQPGVIVEALVGENEELAHVADEFQAALVGDRDRVNGGSRDEDACLDGRACLARCRPGAARHGRRGRR